MSLSSQQRAGSPSSAHPPSTTTTSASSASPPSRTARVVPRRTVLRSVSKTPFPPGGGGEEGERSGGPRRLVLGAGVCEVHTHTRGTETALKTYADNIKPQSSTSPTAQPNAPLLSCGPSSNKPMQPSHTTNRRTHFVLFGSDHSNRRDKK